MLLFAVLSVFGSALLIPFLHRLLPRWSGWLCALPPLMLFGFFASCIARVAGGEPLREAWVWIPSLGVDISFYMDGLGLLFALLISGIGVLIIVYSSAYLSGHHHLGRFCGLILAFMAAMLGTTLAGDLITLFVFWELTGLCSYLLIGFDHEKEASRTAALQALLVTGIGGLALLAGLLLLRNVVGTPDLQTILASGTLVREHELYLPLLLLILTGAFTKSAQFPFHFWLPSAMAAPTPISAYLHSATMVKLGVFLLARLLPAIGGTDAWLWLVSGIGALTMLTGALQAVKEHDLKRILAWSTVSSLGSLTMLLGFGTPAAVTAAMTFLLTHALYKSSLFLTAGAIDHGVGSRDIRLLGGLAPSMPWLAVASLLAALSMAGLPPLFGFISKELVYGFTLQSSLAPHLLSGLFLMANVLMVTVAVMAGGGPFFGRSPVEPLHHHHLSHSLWVAPLIPALLGLLFGLLPGSVESYLIEPAVRVATLSSVTVSLGLWHGLNQEFFLSAITLAFGVLFALYRTRITALFPSLPDYGPSAWYRLFLNGMTGLAHIQTQFMQNGRLRYYLMATIGVTMGLMGLTFIDSGGVPGNLPLPSGYLHEWLVAGIILGGALAVTITNSRLGAVASLGTVGYGVSLVYIIYGAPDLAMTQFCIETLAIVLFVLVLYRLPLFTLLSTPAVRLRDAVMAASIGGLMSLLMLYVISQPLVPHVSEFFLANSLTAAHGRNVVNVILVDFRALDTLGETTVLATAALGVFGLLKQKRSGEGE